MEDKPKHRDIYSGEMFLSVDDGHEFLQFPSSLLIGWVTLKENRSNTINIQFCQSL